MIHYVLGYNDSGMTDLYHSGLLKWENDSQYVYIKFIGVANHFLPLLANSANHILRIILHLVYITLLGYGIQFDIPSLFLGIFLSSNRTGQHLTVIVALEGPGK